MARTRRLRESLIVLLSVLSPAIAGAQTPWSNVSPEGVSVGPVNEGDDPLRISFRMDGGYSSASMPVRVTDSATDKSTRSLSETRRTGVMAGSIAFRRFEIFLSSIAWDSQTGKTPPAGGTSSLSTVREGRIYKQWGDIAAGGRFGSIQLGSPDLLLSVEGGAQFYGKNASEKQRNGCCPGISSDATSVFTRARVGWSQGGSFNASAMGGMLYDRTSNIWEGLEANLDRADENPYEEERRAFGIYGNNGMMLRVLGGAGVGYQVLDSVGLFGETSFELNESDIALRLTPGVRVTALRQSAAFLVYADVNPLGTKQTLSPAEPPLRLNVGMAYAFGSSGKSGRRTGGPDGTGGTGGTGNKPSVRPPLVITLEDPRGAPIADAVLQVIDPRRNVADEARTNMKGQILLDAAKFGSGPLQVKVVTIRPGFIAPPHAIDVDGQRRVLVTPVEALASEIRWTFVDAAGAPIAQSLRVSVIPPSAPGYKPGRYNVPNGVLVLRGQPAGEWRVEVDLDAGKSSVRTMRVVPGRNEDKIPLPIAGAVAAAATPRPVETPRAAETPSRKVDEFLGVFETDLAQVRPAEVKRVAAALRNGGKKLTVVVKRGGDDLFLETLLKARCEALTAALKNEATGGNVPECTPLVLDTPDKVMVE